ncbi:MAG: hypothetical protein H0U54_11075 [Acidobacteria bacterium]|nr:hypothetical protein [Acidobacteriota bacterium]
MTAAGLDSETAALLKKVARPVLLPLLRRLRSRRTTKVPRLSVRDLLPQAEVPTRVDVREDRTILVNGEPFFPLALYYARDEIDDESGEGLARLRAMGFNTVFFSGGLESANRLDRIWGAGLYVCYRPPGQLCCDFVLLKKVVSRFARHPALLFWEMDDEPVLNRVKFSNVEIGCRVVRSVDPYHPILCNQWLSDLDETEEMRRWAGLADVYGFSTYPVPSWCWGCRLKLVEQGWPHSIAVVGAQTELWMSYAPGKPIIPVLQAWGWNCLEDEEAAYPTYQESRFMAYQAVIRGAKGLHHYGMVSSSRPNFACGIPPKIHEDLDRTHADFLEARRRNRRFWSYYSKVVKELSLMSCVFTSRDAAWTLEIRERQTPECGKESIEWRVKRHLNSFVILLVNASDANVTVVILAPELKGRVLKLWGEAKSVEVNSDGLFRDVLEPYAVRIYSDQPDLLAPLSDFHTSID